jgi:hypothetical protein
MWDRRTVFGASHVFRGDTFRQNSILLLSFLQLHLAIQGQAALCGYFAAVQIGSTQQRPQLRVLASFPFIAVCKPCGLYLEERLIKEQRKGNWKVGAK